jgi:chromosome segregation ATPase
MQTPPDSPEEFLIAEESGVSDDDRQDIIRQIDKVVEDNKIPVTSELFKINPKKRGVFFPVLINLIAVAAIAGGFFGASWYFEQKKETLSVESKSFLSPEGRLIAELKREAESKLQEKDSEIGQIQSQLLQIEKERTDLQETMDARIQERETELRNALDRQLALEKSRLEALGRSDDDITARLQAYEEQVSAEQAAELDQFRQQSEAAILEKEIELQQNKELSEQMLAEAEQERLNLEERSEAREEELVEQYEKEKQALSESISEAESQLQTITAFQQQEKLVADQIVGTYAIIQQRMDQGLFDDAKSDLEQLRALLYDSSIESLPNIAARRSTDLFILDSLEELIETRAAVEETKTSDSILEAANLLTTARGAVSRADTAYQEGDSLEAVRLYTDALKLVPSLSHAYASLNTLQSDNNRELITAALSAANEFIKTGNISGAVKAYTDAIVSASGDNSGLVQQAVEGIDDVLSVDRDRKLDAANGVAASLRSQVAALLSNVDSLERDLSARRGDITRLQEELITQELKAAGLESDLSTATAAVKDLTTSIAGLSQTIEEKDLLIRDQQDENAELVIEFQSLSDSYRSLSIQAENLGVDLEEKDSELSSVAITLDERNRTITSMKRDLEQLSSDLAEGDMKIAELESQLSDTEGNLNQENTDRQSLQTQLDEQIALVADLTTRLEDEAAVVQDLNAGLAAETAKVTDLTSRLDISSSRITELDGLLEAEIAAVQDLTAQFAEETAAAQALSANLDKMTDEYESLQTDSVAAASEIEELESEVIAAKRALNSSLRDSGILESDLRTANDTIAELETKLEEAPAEIETVAVAPDLEALRIIFGDYQASIEPLLNAGRAVDIREAKRNLGVFFERPGNLAIPGIYSVWSRTDKAFLDLEKGLENELGQKNALNEIIRYTEYVSAGSDANLAARLAFEALAESNLLYKRAFADIVRIADSEAAGNTPSQPEYILMGTVASFASGTVTIDVKADIGVLNGADVLIKRTKGSGEEMTVAQGVVTKVDGTTVEVDLRLYLDPIPPGFEDSAYLDVASR